MAVLEVVQRRAVADLGGKHVGRRVRACEDRLQARRLADRCTRRFHGAKLARHIDSANLSVTRRMLASRNLWPSVAADSPTLACCANSMGGPARIP
jgi:hypothetical protein